MHMIFSARFTEGCISCMSLLQGLGAWNEMHSGVIARPNVMFRTRGNYTKCPLFTSAREAILTGDRNDGLVNSTGCINRQKTTIDMWLTIYVGSTCRDMKEAKFQGGNETG
jgi:hypothetical protein